MKERSAKIGECITTEKNAEMKTHKKSREISKPSQKKNIELKKIFDGIYFLPNNTHIGVVAIPNENNSTNLYLIDSGENPADGRLVYSECERVFSRFEIKAIIATHGHPDHIGANGFLTGKSGCEVWATRGEREGVENPQSRSASVTGGFPLPEFGERYNFAEGSLVDKIIEGGQNVALGGGFEATFIPLPGHCVDMVGVLVANTAGQKVLFAGDAIFSRKLLAHYWTPFLYDIKKFKQSLEVIEQTIADRYVPSHGGLHNRSEIDALVEFNTLCTISNEKCIERILRVPHTWEGLLKEFADQNGIPIHLRHYTIMGSTLRSYLSYLYAEGRVRYYFENNYMYWTASTEEAPTTPRQSERR